MTVDLHRELAIARRAVREAATICRSVHGQLVAGASLQKGDRSPVTVADFASQAVVCAILNEGSAVPSVVGEESAADLRGEAAKALRAQVVAQVAARRGGDERAVLEWIDRGGADPLQQSVYWTLDPIDGTKGFLRGEQYAIALALIEGGQVTLGALGCPGLQAPDGSRGLLLTAIRGGGTLAAPLFAGDEAPAQSVHVSDVRQPGDARFCESVEAAHSDHTTAARIAARLGIASAPLRMDSQAKYAVLARGEASIYLRLPTLEDYREKIWDHAAGMLVVEEAGGRVTDVSGAALDFSHGRRLEANRGVVATNRHIHDAVLEAVTAALASQ
jgi:3'(2'), 5'-bisphosphate nucleotidase